MVRIHGCNTEKSLESVLTQLHSSFPSVKKKNKGCKLVNQKHLPVHEKIRIHGCNTEKSLESVLTQLHSSFPRLCHSKIP